MTKKKQPNHVKLLFILWLILFFSFSIGSSIYVSYQQAILGNDPTVFLSSFQLFTFGIVLLLFLPLLFFVYRTAKHTNEQKIQKVAYRMLWLLGIWSCFMALSTILALIAPDFSLINCSLPNDTLIA